mmetsp:Transcript_12947/g.33330  ORF Transcript_12947/g.33330 Transcript_12947/m.33330 type:complete len:247 (+) Transcript_12947:2681-3421(+)
MVAQHHLLAVQILGHVKVLHRGLAQPLELTRRGAQARVNAPKLCLQNLHRGSCEGSSPRPAQVVWLEPEPKLSLVVALDSDCRVLGPGDVVHHLAMTEAAHLQADLVTHIELGKGRERAKVARVGERLPQRPDGLVVPLLGRLPLEALRRHDATSKPKVVCELRWKVLRRLGRRQRRERHLLAAAAAGLRGLPGEHLAGIAIAFLVDDLASLLHPLAVPLQRLLRDPLVVRLHLHRCKACVLDPSP